MFGKTRIKQENEWKGRKKEKKRCEVGITLTDIRMNDVIVLD